MTRVVGVGACLVLGGCALKSRAVETVPSDWAAVRSLPSGTQVRVTLRWSETVRGALLGADEAGIRVETRTLIGGRERRIDRQHVSKVFRRGDRRTARGAAIGTLIGLGSGVMVAVTQGSVDTFALKATAWYTAWGAGLGALGGYESREEIPIYAAPAGAR